MVNEIGIATIIPVYDEIQCLPGSLEQVHSFLEANFADFEIIIVESGSTDGSAQACDLFAQGHESVTVIHEGARNGFGSALQLGFNSASKDLVWAVSVDLPFSLDAIFSAIPLFEECGTVLSYRSADDRGLYRRLQSVAYNRLVKLLLGLKATHINSTFKVYRRSVVQSLNLESRGWLVDAEIVYKLEQMRVAYAEVPVPLIERKAGESSVGPMTAVQLFWDLVKFAASEFWKNASGQKART